MQETKEEPTHWKHKHRGISYDNNKLILAWAKEVRSALGARVEDDRDDDLVGDLLLVIEWNGLGLAHRGGVNAACTKAALVAGTRTCLLSYYCILTNSLSSYRWCT